MKNRFMSALIFAIVLIGAFVLKAFVSNFFFDAVILLISVIAAFETSKILTKMGKFNNKFLATILPCFIFISTLCGIITDDILGLAFTMAINIGVILLFFIIAFVEPYFNIRKTKHEIASRKLAGYSVTKYSFVKALNTSIAFVYPTFLLSTLYLINHIEELTTTFPGLANLNGIVSLFVLVIAFLIPIFTDTFAFFMGSVIGGKKIAPKISPNKTISGSVGGLVWCVLLSICVFLIFNAFPSTASALESTGITLWKVAIISVLGSVLGQIGDIFESYLKRKAGVKDSGNIMPGHGGMLDRFDSHAFVAPFILIAFCIIFCLL